MDIKELVLNLENFISKAKHPDEQFVIGGTVSEAKRMFEELKHLLGRSDNSAMVQCQLWPNPNGGCPVGRIECYKYSACQVAQHQ